MAKLCLPDAAAEVMYHLVTHNIHGYSQYSRLGDGGKETITLSDGTKVAIATGDRDCSSACITSYQAVGLDVNATYTGNMRAGFLATGKFKWHPWGDGYLPKNGDMYLNESHHTAMSRGIVNGQYQLMEFSRSETFSIDGVEGDQDGWESHVRDAYVYSHGWDGILECTDRSIPEDEPDILEDEMTECIINIPKSDDMATNVMVYVCGDRIHDIPDPEALKYLNAVYKAVHGKDIPTFEMSGARAVPAFQRFVSAVRGGIPDPSIFPAVDIYAGRSANRAAGNKGTE